MIFFLYISIIIVLLLLIHVIYSTNINNDNNSDNYNNYDLDYLLGEVKKELEIKQQHLKQQSECKVTYSIDPLAEEFYLELIKGIIYNR